MPVYHFIARGFYSEAKSNSNLIGFFANTHQYLFSSFIVIVTVAVKTKEILIFKIIIK